jgi:SAM-dependent methyltransferase
MTSFIQTLRPNQGGRKRVLGLSEILPRISLIEDSIEGLRVLEHGVQDVGSLIHIERAGAERVAGTSGQTDVLDRAKMSGRRIELINMDDGRLDFPSASFDVIMVNDLAGSAEANPDFFSELRRVLAPDGFCVLTFDASGHSVAELVSPRQKRIREAQPRKMVDLVRGHFEQVQFLEQTPFVGVALLSEDADPMDVPVSLDASLAGIGPKASHILALCGPVAPVGDQRTLIELPFSALEAEASARFAQTSSEVQSLEHALQKTRIDLQAKEASLRSIGERLKPLKEAVMAKLSATTQTPDSELRVGKLREQIDEIQFEMQGERARRRALEAQLVASESEDVPQEVQYTSAASEAELSELREQNAAFEKTILKAQLDNGILQKGMLRLQRELELQVSPPTLNSEAILQLEISLVASQKECEELRERLESTERQLSSRISSSVLPRFEYEEEEEEEAQEVSLWQRLAEVEQDNELQRRRVIDLEESNRESTAKLRALKEAQDVANIQGDHTEAGYRAKIGAMSGALQASESEVHKLREMLNAAYDHQSSITSNSERALDEVENRFALEREIAGQMQSELDSVRREVYETRTSLEHMQRALVAKTTEFDDLRTRFTGIQADKGALELVSAQLTQNLQSFREKFYNLKAERDTLMETSRALIDERDIALQLVDGVGESERRVRELTISLEGAQAAIRRLEWELDASQTEIRRLNALNQDQEQMLALQERGQENLAERSQVLEKSERVAQQQIRDLEERLSFMHQKVATLELAESAAKDESIELQHMVYEVSHEAMDMQRDLQTYKDRAVQLQSDVYEAEDVINDLLVEQMRHEASTLDFQEARQEAQSRLAIEHSDKVVLEEQIKVLSRAEASSQTQTVKNESLAAEIQDLESHLAGLLGAKEESEIALGHTLKEAAVLVEANRSLHEENGALVEQVNRFAEAHMLLEGAEEVIFVLENSNRELEEQLLVQTAVIEARSLDSSVAKLALLEDERDYLSVRNQMLVSDRDALNSELINLKREVDSAMGAASEHEQTVMELANTQMTLAEAKAVNEKNHKRTCKLEEMISTYERETAQLAQQMEEFERRASVYDNQFREAQAAAMDALEQLNEHEASALDKADKIERYKNEKTAMILRITSLEEEVDSAKETAAELSRLQDIQSELEQTREELSALTSSNTSLREAWELVSTEHSEKVMSSEQEALAARDREYSLQEEIRRLTESAVLNESHLRSQMQSLSENEKNAREIALQAQQKNAEGFQRIGELEAEIKRMLPMLESSTSSGDYETEAKLSMASRTIQHLKQKQAESEAAIDEVRAQLGHKMQSVRQSKEVLTKTREELAAQVESGRRLSAALKLARSEVGSPEKVREREQQLARFEAKTASSEAENLRLRQLAQKSESSLVEFELKISTLENTIMERNRQVELLRNEVADKSDRLRRYSERLDKI